MKWLLIIAVFTDNGLASSVRERPLGAFDTLAACTAQGHAELLKAAPLVRGSVRRIELYCEPRGRPNEAADVPVGRAAR